jgi:hypothetical protein
MFSACPICVEMLDKQDILIVEFNGTVDRAGCDAETVHSAVLQATNF